MFIPSISAGEIAVIIIVVACTLAKVLSDNIE